jgi:hypothetical protein
MKPIALLGANSSACMREFCGTIVNIGEPAATSCPGCPITAVTVPAAGARISIE